MRRQRRSFSEEINLTPLLDVIFTVLFIVMLTSTISRGNMEDSYDEKISDLEDEKIELQEEKELLEKQNEVVVKINDSLRTVEDQAMLITIINEEDGGQRSVDIYLGGDTEPVENIVMGKGKQEYIRNALISKIESIIGSEQQNGKNGMPVFIVFSIDKNIISVEEEAAIEAAVDELDLKYDNIYYQEKERGL